MTAPPALRHLIAGAGAIGCTLAARLAAAGQPVELLARGRTLAQLRAHGLRLDDLDGRWEGPVAAVAVDEARAAPDVLWLACKSQDLPALARQVQPLVGPATAIVPLVNGVPYWYFHRSGSRFEGRAVHSVDPDGRLSQDLPLDQVLGAVVFITAEATGPGCVQSRTPHLVMLGEPAGGSSARLEAVCAALTAAGVEARALPRIRDKLWTKLVANVSSNPLSVTAGATLDAIYSDPALLATSRAVMLEVMLAAAAHGARLEIDPIEFLRLGAAMGPVRTSMLQDLERGRPLELAAIGDAVLELAALYELPMPHTSALIAAARRRADAREAAAA